MLDSQYTMPPFGTNFYYFFAFKINHNHQPNINFGVNPSSIYPQPPSPASTDQDALTPELRRIDDEEMERESDGDSDVDDRGLQVARHKIISAASRKRVSARLASMSKVAMASPDCPHPLGEEIEAEDVNNENIRHDTHLEWEGEHDGQDQPQGGNDTGLLFICPFPDEDDAGRTCGQCFAKQPEMERHCGTTHLFHSHLRRTVKGIPPMDLPFRGETCITHRCTCGYQTARKDAFQRHQPCKGIPDKLGDPPPFVQVPGRPIGTGTRNPRPRRVHATTKMSGTKRYATTIHSVQDWWSDRYEVYATHGNTQSAVRWLRQGQLGGTMLNMPNRHRTRA